MLSKLKRLAAAVMDWKEYVKLSEEEIVKLRDEVANLRSNILYIRKEQIDIKNVLMNIDEQTMMEMEFPAIEEDDDEGGGEDKN